MNRGGAACAGTAIVMGVVAFAVAPDWATRA